MLFDSYSCLHTPISTLTWSGVFGVPVQHDMSGARVVVAATIYATIFRLLVVSDEG
jgi:hypothetical protein